MAHRSRRTQHDPPAASRRSRDEAQAVPGLLSRLSVAGPSPEFASSLRDRLLAAAR